MQCNGLQCGESRGGARTRPDLLAAGDALLCSDDVCGGDVRTNALAGQPLDGVDFLVTNCGHVFCLECEAEVLSSARCSYCETQLTDEDIERCCGSGAHKRCCHFQHSGVCSTDELVPMLPVNVTLCVMSAS